MYNHAPQRYVCQICLAGNGVEKEEFVTKQQDIVYHDESVTAIVAAGWWPNNKGHVLVFPNIHAENIYNISDEILGKVYAVAKQVAIALKVTYGCDGTSMRQHNEPAGGQDLWHFHVHVFPRYADDKLYQTPDARTFVSPQERLPYAEKLRVYFAGERKHQEYSHTFPDYKCPICPAVKGEENSNTLIKQSDIIYKDALVTAFISTFFKKNNPGHVIIVPNSHYENVYVLPDDISNKMQILAKKVSYALKVTYHCDGISTAQHNEPEGDQHAFHYHFHVFPRYQYDDLYETFHEKVFPNPEERAAYARKLMTFFIS